VIKLLDRHIIFDEIGSCFYEIWELNGKRIDEVMSQEEFINSPIDILKSEGVSNEEIVKKLKGFLKDNKNEGMKTLIEKKISELEQSNI
jgi:hypothetical protein